MILKSTPVNPKRNRVTVHASGVLHDLAQAGAVLSFTDDSERLYYVTFDERDLRALKKIVRDLERAKEKTK